MQRSLLLLFTMVLFPAILFAQSFSDINLSEGKTEHGGFGGLIIQSSHINGQEVVLSGGKLAWLIDHTFYIGGSGYTLLSEINATNPDTLNSEYLNVSYGGLLLGTHFAPDSIVHFNAEIMLGAGTVYFTDYSIFSPHSHDQMDTNATHTFFFVSEFGGNLVFNISRYFHIELGLSYRKSLGLDLSSLPPSGFDGLNYNLSLLFGLF